MAYQRSPSVAAGALTTNATLNTLTTNRGLVNPPGAGFALRIVGLHFAGFRNNTGHVNVLVHDGNGGVIWRGAMLVGGPDDADIPEPGLLLPTNVGLQVDDISEVASQNYYFTAYYFTDTI